MRILIAHSFYRIPGGEDRYVRQQVALLGASHDVELLSASNEDLGVTAGTAARMTYSAGGVARAEAAIRRFRPDVVHVHNIYPSLGPSVHVAATRAGVPLVMTVHNYRLRCPNGLMFTEGATCRRCEPGFYAHAVLHRCFPSRKQAGAYAGALWSHRFLLRLERKVTMFIAPSEFVAGRLHEWGLDRVRMIRNFTDIPTGPAPAPGSHGFFAGRLSAEKGLDVLLHALRAAGDPPFVVLGDGPQRESLEHLAARLGLERVRFPGRVAPERVGELVREARFAAFPSRWDENAPLAALEAMAAGRPLLVTRRGGLTELADGGRGLVCAPDDPDELADGIRLLMRDDDLCARSGAAALAFAREELSPDRHLARLEAAYEAAAFDARPAVAT